MSETKATFLLLRGLTREQRHWGEFVPLLQQQFPAAHILALDIPGNGARYQQVSPASIAAMTDALRQQLIDLGHTGPLQLIALSMGGMIALDWMQRYPSEIASAVLVNCSVSSFSPFYQRLRWQIYSCIFKIFRQNPAERERTILQLTSNLQRENAALLASWQQWQQQCPVSSSNALRQLRAAANFKPLHKPSQPLLLIASVADQLVDYRCSLKLQQVWQLPLVTHPSAGHDVALDDPAWLVDVINDWMRDKPLLPLP